MNLDVSRRLLLAIVVTAGLTLGAASTRGTSGARKTASVSVNAPLQPSALARLVVHPIPERDLYALTQQLVLRPPHPIPHVVRRTSPNYPVGHQDQFYALSEDANRYFAIHATIRAKTPHLYMYVENGVQVATADLQRVAERFEQHIYPTDRSYFGSEWRPGVDGDPHITCLFAKLRSAGTGGYYSANDEYPRAVDKYSNEREMIYIDAGMGIPGDSFLAHEFQHMIHWHMHPGDNAWLNEGMSMLAEKLNGFTPGGEAESFLAEPTTQLDTWRETASASLPHYGGAYLFLSYLYERYGRGFISDLLADKRYTDFQLIDDVLKKRHISTSADKLFTQWVVANAVARPSAGAGTYGYKELSHPVNFQAKLSVPFTHVGTVPPYAAQDVSLDSLQGAKPFRLSFSAPTSVPLVPASSASSFWWSNRGDMSDTRLERNVDLRRVSHATLRFKTWYDIEKDYDYGYVEASLDGGKTWDTLSGTHTTKSNPNGANYGNAYTGQSKGWRTESVNLSRYAGHRIKLRFEYVTDEEYNGHGMLVKGITIPEIGFHDSFTGWRAHGFLPVASNALPSRWTVQLISSTAQGMRVTRLPLHGGKGSILVNPAAQGLKKLIVAVFTIAPKTTVTSQYRLSASSQP